MFYSFFFRPKVYDLIMFLFDLVGLLSHNFCFWITIIDDFILRLRYGS